MPLYTLSDTGQVLRIDYGADGATQTVTVVTGTIPAASGTPPSVTATDLITSAMRLIGAVASGDSPTSDELTDGLMALNQMIDQWNAQRLMIYTITISEFPLVVGQQVYTCGSGGDFDMQRPSKIERMSIVSLLNPSQPLELPIEYLTDKQWQEVPVKAISSSLPLQVYDDGAFPLRNLNFRYIPTIAVNCRIYSWSALPYFADLGTAYAFPPAYAKAIRYSLAVELAAEFGANAVAQLPVIAPIANDARATIKRMNAPVVDLRVDPALQGTGSKRVYNWLTDNATRR